MGNPAHATPPDCDAVCFICKACGMQFAEMHQPPDSCPICEDERQYVAWQGQDWTDMAALRDNHAIRFEMEDDVTSLRQEPAFAINQRAFLIPHASGNIMWECLSVVTDEALCHISAQGGVTAIAISHPHFYAAMVEWSEALGGVPILLHAADRQWVQRPSSRIQYWDGDQLALTDTISLVHLGGHFAGSAALWWKDGPRAGGALFPGDAIQVAMDRRHATFMYSYPNAIPLGPTAIEALQRRTAPLSYADMFGFSRGRQIIGGAKAAIERSFERYRVAISR